MMSTSLERSSVVMATQNSTSMLLAIARASRRDYTETEDVQFSEG